MHCTEYIATKHYKFEVIIHKIAFLDSFHPWNFLTFGQFPYSFQIPTWHLQVLQTGGHPVLMLVFVIWHFVSSWVNQMLMHSCFVLQSTDGIFHFILCIYVLLIYILMSVYSDNESAYCMFCWRIFHTVLIIDMSCVATCSDHFVVCITDCTHFSVDWLLNARYNFTARIKVVV